jgi:hypothetical protein
MPLLRYFLFVGGALIALLFVANAALPEIPLPDNLTSASDVPPLRIRSDHTLPARVVIDTRIAVPAPARVAPAAIAQLKPQRADQVAAPMVANAPVQPALAEISPKARVREAFAQLPQEPDAFEPKMIDMATVVLPEPKMYPARQVPKKAAAKPRNSRPMMIVAQQPRLGGVATW